VPPTPTFTQPHYGCLGSEARPCDNQSVIQHLRNHRHAIRIFTTEQGEVRLLTISYVAAALGRTRWTIRHWQRLGLLPPSAFVINRDNKSSRRWLYPEPFVHELALIMQMYPGPRIEQTAWPGFRKRTFEAYHKHVDPLLGGCVIPVEIELDRTGPKVSA
jgi:hypothetical protein